METSAPMQMSQYMQALDMMKGFFDRTTSIFEEDDSQFAPRPGMFTVSQQVAHVAQTIDWFLDGAFGVGFDMEFEAHEAQVREFESLEAARDWLDRSVTNAKQIIGSKTKEEMLEPLPEGEIMGGIPRAGIIDAIADHTAHHRGSLAVYARMLDRQAPMPYGE